MITSLAAFPVGQMTGTHPNTSLVLALTVREKNVNIGWVVRLKARTASAELPAVTLPRKKHTSSLHAFRFTFGRVSQGTRLCMTNASGWISLMLSELSQMTRERESAWIDRS